MKHMEQDLCTMTIYMKITLLTLCLALVVTAEETYQTINNDLNITELLNNERLLISYANCLLNKGPCTPDVNKVKDKLPEALATRCAKCTEKQKQMAKQLVNEVKNNRPQLWKQFVDMYDPDGKHQAAFKDFLETK